MLPRRAMLLRPVRHLVDQLGDVMNTYLAAVHPTDERYQAFIGECRAVGDALRVGAAETRPAIERYFDRRRHEIKQVEARLAVVPASTGPTRRRWGR
jgi:hypothetical protein